MASLDTNKILNESKPKVLLREFNKLREDYSRINAVKYKSLYENEELSFILTYSRYIFAEPMKGFEFYKNIMENHLIPIDRYLDEFEKFRSFVDENKEQMGEDQRNLYEEFESKLEKNIPAIIATVNINDMGNKEALYPIFDAFYDSFKAGADKEALKAQIVDYFEKNLVPGTNYGIEVILGAIIFGLYIPEVSVIAYRAFKEDITDKPATVEESIRSQRIIETVSSFSGDYLWKYISENPNMNFRFLLLGVHDLSIAAIIMNVMTKTVSNEMNFSSPLEMMNRIIRDEEFKMIENDHVVEEDINPLLIKRSMIIFRKAVYENGLKIGMDDWRERYYDDVVEQICVESDDYTEVPDEIEDIIKTLNKEIKLCNEIIDKYYKDHKGDGEYKESTYLERYFSPDGTPGKIVGQSIGGIGESPKKKGVDEEPKKAMSSSKIEDEDDEKEDDEKDRKATDDDLKKVFKDQNTASKVRGDIIRFCVDTYKNGYKNYDFKDKEDGLGYQPTFVDFMIIDGNLTATLSIHKDDILMGAGLDFQDGVVDSLKKIYKEYSFTSDDSGIIIKKVGSVKEATEDDDKEKEEEFSNVDTSVKKPKSKNIFQGIQNKALDADVQFKKKVAQGKRLETDARNAVKAVAKIPENIVNSVKKQVSEWDELDDNRRKEYIIKPGVRKKYFRALRICLMHYGAFAINPVLNIVLFICQALGRTKDVRIRNELIRELKAEIRVTEEKISDANANGDQKQKYRLMRIKEKLEAEMARVTLNSKVI